ncbi:hypothetical protein MD484_g4192, partial [Candolleomyces efflorescens]
MRAKSLLSLITLPLRNGYVFLVCVLVLFMQAGFHAGRRDKTISAEDTLLITPEIQEQLLAKSANVLQPLAGRRGVVDEHPIPKLMEEAEERYRNKLSRQSKSLKKAVAEYKRRYKRPPPKGFDEWWSFARRNDVRLVDEYDGLMEDLEPFWNLGGAELRRRAGQWRQAAELPLVDLVRIRDGVAESLPYLEFPINAIPENRVLVPWEHMQYPNLTIQDSSQGLSAMLGGPFRVDWTGEDNTWDRWRRTCHPDSVARRVFSSLRNAFRMQTVNYFSQDDSPGSDFDFTPNTSASVDFCNKPQAHYQQGHFFTDFRPIHALYPIFSPAKAQGYLDIRIPSHYYYGNTPRYTYGWDSVNLEVKEVDSMELPWEMKEDKLFWRGASTGGGNHPPGFAPHFHRHRFLQMTSDTSETNRTVTFADPPGSNRFVAASVPVAQLNEEVMDTAFVKAVSAEAYPGGESALKKLHRFANSVHLGRHWAFKYLVDLDGVGYSGRFMAYLASDSVPLKATVYKEFFSDWIEPWLHFIPLSSTYQEVYNIHAYFSGPTKSALEALGSRQASVPLNERRSMDGDRRLRRIARAGKEWKRTIGRHADMEGAYIYEDRSGSTLPSAEPSSYNDEAAYRQRVAALNAARDRQFATTGHIVVDSTQLVLFFRSKSGISQALDFPIDVDYNSPPALDVLVTACRPHQTSDYNGYMDRESLFYPPTLPLTTSLELANFPILDAVRTSLFPNLPPGSYLTAMKDKLELLLDGGRLERQPAHLRNDGRAATVIITLPVHFQGGALIVREPSGAQERFITKSRGEGDLEWVAFLANCDYETEVVDKGYRVMISYGVYVRSFSPEGAIKFECLSVPTDAFFDALAPVMNLSRGRTVGFYLGNDYLGVNPSLVTADKLVPQLKAGDYLLYHAFKMYKLKVDLHWTAGEYFWPTDRLVELDGEDIAATVSSHASPRMPTGYPGSINTPASRNVPIPAFGGGYPPVGIYPTPPGSAAQPIEQDPLRLKVEESGGKLLSEANLTVLTDWNHTANAGAVERVPFISHGELKKFVVNVLLVVFIP